MNLPRLKGIIRERGRNYNQCAEAIGRSVAAFNYKINGRVKFNIEELENLGNYLEMSDGEKVDIFLR